MRIVYTRACQLLGSGISQSPWQMTSCAWLGSSVARRWDLTCLHHPSASDDQGLAHFVACLMGVWTRSHRESLAAAAGGNRGNERLPGLRLAVHAEDVILTGCVGQCLNCEPVSQLSVPKP